MSDDLKLVQQFEKETGIKLKEVPMEMIGIYNVTGFAADDNGRVRGLAFWDEKLLRLPALLSKFQQLEKLVLPSNRISDISSLKELKNLKHLYLMDNRITHMPAEFLDLGLDIKWKIGPPYEDIFLGDNPLESPPAEIIKKGNEAIRKYFKSLAREQQALKQRPSDKIDKELSFISYSRRDEDFVLHLCKKLKEVGVEIWVDQWDIAPGDNWDKSIDEALYKCTRMLIILSPDAVNSNEVQSELYTFFKEDKPVFPIVYRSCRIPRRLNVIQHINFTSSDLGDKTKIAELAKIITK